MKKLSCSLPVTLISFLFVVSNFIACKKQDSNNLTNEGYTSLTDFYQKNGVALQNYSVNAVTGGTFTTPQGTVVTISPNAFTDSVGQLPTGSLSIDFKDIYKKSDMLLSDVPSMTASGAPLKSGGEFFINVKSGNKTMFVKSDSSIKVQQPLNGTAVDTAMEVFIGATDTAGGVNWAAKKNYQEILDSVIVEQSDYLFSLYQFSSPASSGSWCNSDNSGYFSAYTQTTLTIHGSFDTSFNSAGGVAVFLVFKNINSMVHVYYASGNNYPYAYAPVGLSATVVAIASKDGNLYSSFTPITISANQTVNFNFQKTSTDAFKAALKALD